MLSCSTFADRLLIVKGLLLRKEAFRLVRKVAIGLIAFALLVAIALLMLISLNGFPYKYMDLDDSGFVSPREALRTLDMGIRNADVGREECVEIFALKDGQPIRQICSEDH